jgi:hypothetical protein
VQGAESINAVFAVMSCKGMSAVPDELSVQCKMSHAMHNNVHELIHDASNERHTVQLCANTYHKLRAAFVLIWSTQN